MPETYPHPYDMDPGSDPSQLSGYDAEADLAFARHGLTNGEANDVVSDAVGYDMAENLNNKQPLHPEDFGIHKDTDEHDAMRKLRIQRETEHENSTTPGPYEFTVEEAEVAYKALYNAISRADDDYRAGKVGGAPYEARRAKLVAGYGYVTRRTPGMTQAEDSLRRAA